MSDSIKENTARVVKHRDERDWKQFHNPKDVAISLSLEAAEVLEHFQWKTTEETQTFVDRHSSKIADELSDVLYWVLLMSHDLGIDLSSAFDDKMRENERKYPIEKAKGRHTKYTDL